MGYPAVYYEDGDYEPFIKNEHAVERFKHQYEHHQQQVPRSSLEWVCCFDTPALEHMPLWQIILMLSAHDKVFHDHDNSDRWNLSTILSTIDEGIENSLGEGSSRLILTTLKLVYGIDKEMILKEPAKFEGTLKKVLGRRVSGVIIKDIKNEMKNWLLV